jgi:hypothetical protein
MTALQTRQSDQATLNGQEFFRLFQALESGGDIYEINTSTKALCVGPQSDLANFNVNFFDKQAPDNIDEVNLAVGNPVIGRVDALLATEYPTASGLPALILITARDLVDNTFFPSTFRPFVNPQDPADFVAARPKPRIDVFSYLSPPEGFAPLRDDRQYFYPFVAAAGLMGDAYYLLPYYGRRYGHLNFTNLSDANEPDITYTLTVVGINLSAGKQDVSGQVPGGEKAAETPLGTLVVAEGTTSDLVITAEKDGLFDLISIRMSTNIGLQDLNSSMRFTVSDKVG